MPPCPVFWAEPGRHLIVIEQYSPGRRFGLTLAGPSYAELGKLKKATLGFFDNQAPFERAPFVGEMDSYGKTLFFDNIALSDKSKPDPAAQEPIGGLPLLDTDLAAEVDFVSVSGKEAEVRMLTGSLGEPFKILNQCVLGLIDSWGLDAEKHRTATRMPRMIDEKATMSKVFSSVPWQRLGAGTSILRLHLTIDEAGKIEACNLIEMTDPKVEAGTCKAMMRAKFEPALDAAGSPMRSFQTYDITTVSVTTVQSLTL